MEEERKARRDRILLDGLTPVLVPAEYVDEGWLVCGRCGYNGEVTHYIHVNTPEVFEPVCNCPLPAVLSA